MCKFIGAVWCGALFGTTACTLAKPNLCGIENGTAADGDNAVWREGAHLRGARDSGCRHRAGNDGVKNFTHNTARRERHKHAVDVSEATHSSAGEQSL